MQKSIPEPRVRNVGCPYQGIDAIFFWNLISIFISRNEGRPYQGIDTTDPFMSKTVGNAAKMQVAPIRAFPSIKKIRTFHKEVSGLFLMSKTSEFIPL